MHSSALHGAFSLFFFSAHKQCSLNSSVQIIELYNQCKLKKTTSIMSLFPGNSSGFIRLVLSLLDVFSLLERFPLVPPAHD